MWGQCGSFGIVKGGGFGDEGARSPSSPPLALVVWGQGGVGLRMRCSVTFLSLLSLPVSDAAPPVIASRPGRRCPPRPPLVTVLVWPSTVTERASPRREDDVAGGGRLAVHPTQTQPLSGTPGHPWDGLFCWLRWALLLAQCTVWPARGGAGLAPPKLLFFCCSPPPPPG